MENFRNIAGYQFVHLTELKPLRARLLSFCKERRIKGTILLSPEGINLFAAGEGQNVEALLNEIRTIPGLEKFQVKFSPSDEQPFNRMLVRIKKEIIAFGVPGIDPANKTSPKLPPKVLKQWLDEGRPLTLLDTRNDYEIKLGTFDHALPAGIDHFRHFPEAVRRLPVELKDQPIVMFCTGGIRCEKAGPYMEREGFKNIFQLDGGILKYFEECGGAHFRGECFVFDQRVGVDPSLQETDSSQCFRCLSPLTPEEQEDPCYVPNVSCSYCFKTNEEKRKLRLTQRHQVIASVTSPLPGSEPYDNYRPFSVPLSCDEFELLDFLGVILPHIPRSEWDQLASQGLILDRSKKPVTVSHLVRAGERYLYKLPAITEPDINPSIEILHEDDALIVLNKPAPLPVHAGGRFNRNTLQHILNQVYHPQKPRPAHRLDANTTGVILLTRTRHFAAQLQPQFEKGQVEKTYLVQVHGEPEWDAHSCHFPISAEPGDVGSRVVDEAEGLKAWTDFRKLKPGGTSLLEATPKTGRTNQIRVHLWRLGHPVCGDPLYLPDRNLGRSQTLGATAPPLRLHSWKIRFFHPLEKKLMEFVAPPPFWA